ncbi:MAG: serine hydrolase domain-containing protein [Acidimicrobiales bacterium]
MVDVQGYEVQGVCEAGFEGVREAFAANFTERGDVGASAVVTHDGRVVADLWAGAADSPDSAAWERDTIVNVYSTTKTMSCLAGLVLASRGEVDVDSPVARYWPEFAANGKDGVLVRHLLAHTAGLSGWEAPLTGDDLYDWEKCTSLLAAQAPWWTPGSKSGYHALTQGYLIGEVVRRVSGQSVGAFFRDEIAGPLGADFFIGLPASEDHRTARVIPPPAPLPGADGVGDRASVAYKTFSNPPLRAEQSFEEAWRRAEIPAAGGTGNARGVAAAQTVVACGGEVNGVRLLSEKVCERIFDVQAAGRDLVMGVGVTFGVGYGLNSPKAPIGPNPRTCYWGGWGGSLVVNDLDARLCMAYVMNRMGEGTVGDDRAHAILRAAYVAIGQGEG